VERMHKKFPIEVNYKGLSVATTMHENIVVTVENGEITGAYLQD
jgi:pyrimidine operon attenuation protein/uracil phosphoribosyltransferase